MTRLEHDGTDPDTGQNRWVLHLLALEAGIVSSLPDQLETLLTDPDANKRVIGRLFPVSYSDPQEERINRRLLGEGLLEERKLLLAGVRQELASATRFRGGLKLELTPLSMDLWVRFLNDIRLVIATDLGIERNLGEEPADEESPDSPKHALLEYLGGVEAILVEALSREF